MRIEDIQAEQAQPHTSLDNLKPMEDALWEIALQIALSNQKINELIATVDRVATRNGGGR